MKKILFTLPIVILLAAGCGNSAASPSASQNNSQNEMSQQAPAQAPAAASAGAPVSQFKTVAVPLPGTLYTASGDGFGINFPGTPKITNSTFTSPTAGSVPFTEYRQQYGGDGENAYYTVYVYHYPSGYQFAGDYLSTAVQTFDKVVAGSFPGTQIASEQPTELLGSPALSAVIIVPLKQSNGATANTPDYVLVTTKNYDAYIISTYGMAQSDYSAFLNSFSFK